MLDQKTAPYAALLLRVTLAIAFLAHAGLKLFVFTPAGTAGFFDSVGVPSFLAYVVIFAEIIGAVALLLGYKTRVVAVVLAPVLLGATIFVHGANGWLFSNQGGGWEFPVFWLAALITMGLLGDGAYSVTEKFQDKVSSMN
ncbi:MAG: DoxX family protein [Halopseudomonas aestusnigri]